MGLLMWDHRTGCVFNGSVPGKQYSTKGISERSAQNVFSLHRQKAQILGASIGQATERVIMPQTGIPSRQEHEKSLTNALLSPLKDDGYMPGQIRRSKRKKT